MTTLSTPDLRVVVFRKFGDLGDTIVDTFTAICLAESGGVVEAVNDNYPTYQPDPNSPYRWDRGLPQINSVWGFDPNRLLTEPDYAMQCARTVFNAQGFHAWSTYNSGAYYKHLPIPHPVDQYALIAQSAFYEAGILGRLQALAAQHAPKFVMEAERDSVKQAVESLVALIDGLE